MSLKLTPEELQNVIQSKSDYDNTIFSLGELTVQIDNAEKSLLTLKGERANFLSTMQIVIKKQQELGTDLTQKYGSGNINLETGEITQA